MANDARISLVGTVVQDPQNRQVNNYTVFSMRVSVATTKKQANSPYPATDLYDVAVWGKAGEALIDKIKAKTKVWVTGDFMAGEPWKDRNGEQHISLRVTADHVKILSGGNFNNNNNNNNRQQAPVETAVEEINEEEAPF